MKQARISTGTQDLPMRWWSDAKTPGAMIGGIVSNAFAAIGSNRQRSILTMLGIGIGVAAFIAIVTLSQGATDSFTSKLGFLAQTITVSRARNATNTSLTLSDRDVKILSQLQHVVAVSPTISDEAEVVFGKKHWSTTLSGVSFSYLQMQNVSIGSGAWWSSEEEQSRRHVVVLGTKVVENIFGQTGIDPIGQTVRIGAQLYHVIGVIEPDSLLGNDGIYVPYTAVYTPSKPNQIAQISIQVDGTDNLDTVQTEIQMRLGQLHHIATDGSGGFDVTEAIGQLKQTQQQLGMLSGFMSSIAVISLIVGGIGIMNIMLVSVTERTREIGLRSALGAPPSAIAVQFLLEALALSIISGGLGLGLGLLMGYGLSSLLNVSFIVNTSSFLIAFGVSTAIGVGFGLYPALRASRLDPIIALRSF